MIDWSAVDSGTAFEDGTNPYLYMCKVIFEI